MFSDEFISSMYSSAVQKFNQTTVYELLNEKVQETENNCKSNFQEDECEIFNAWEEAFTRYEEEKSSFIYAQAFQDCIDLLKGLKVI